MKCPACGTGDFYEGLATLNCVNDSCVHYVPPATYRGGVVEHELATAQPAGGYVDAWLDTGIRTTAGWVVRVRRGVYSTKDVLTMSSPSSYMCLRVHPDGRVDRSAWWWPTATTLYWPEVEAYLEMPYGFNVVPRPSYAWAYERGGVEVERAGGDWRCSLSAEGGTKGTTYNGARFTPRTAWEAYTGESFPEDR